MIERPIAFKKKKNWTHLLVVHKNTLEIWIFSVIDSHLGIRLPWKLTQRQRVPPVIYYAIRKVIPTFYCFYSNQHTARSRCNLWCSFFFLASPFLNEQWKIRFECLTSFDMLALILLLCLFQVFVYVLLGRPVIHSQTPITYFIFCETFYDFGRMTHA